MKKPSKRGDTLSSLIHLKTDSRPLPISTLKSEFSQEKIDAIFASIEPNFSPLGTLSTPAPQQSPQYINKDFVIYKNTSPSNPSNLTPSTDPPKTTPKPPKQTRTIRHKTSLYNTILKPFSDQEWNHLAGVDKITLTTQYFTLKSRKPFKTSFYPASYTSPKEYAPIRELIEKSEVSGSIPFSFESTQPHFLTTKDGEEVRGRSLFLDPIDKPTHPYNLDIDRRGLRLIFNPSKMSEKYYNSLANEDDLDFCFEYLSEELHRYGIDVDLKETSVSRLDFAKDRRMEKNVYEYSPVFNMLRLSRSTNVSQYPSGYTVSNSNRAFELYDKGAEFFKGKIPTSNFMRAEYRLTTTEAVQKFGINYFGELLNMDATKMNESFNHLFTKDVLRVDNLEDQLLIDYNQLRLMIQESKKNHNRNILANVYQLIAAETIVKNYGFEGFRSILSEEFSRNHVYTEIKKLEKIIKNAKPTKKFSLYSAYSEIKEKFAA